MTITDRDPGDENQPAQQPARDPLRPVAGTVIEGLVAVYDKDGKFLLATARKDIVLWNKDRKYKCRVVIEGEA